MDMNVLSDFHTDIFPYLNILQSTQCKTFDIFFPCVPWTAPNIHQIFSNNALQRHFFHVDVEKQVSISTVVMLLEHGKVAVISVQ